MKHWHYILIGITIIIFPILLNYLIQIPLNFHIIGNEVNWLAFWGSYIGGVITAFIGFFTIFSSVKRDNIKYELANKEQYIAKLEITLAECVALFDTSKINKIALYLDSNNLNKLTINPTYLKELDLYCETIISKSNAFNLIFDTKYHTDSNIKKKFISAYNNCSTFFISTISNIENIICNISEKEYNKCEKEINDIIKITNQLKEDEKAKGLYENAKQWLEEEHKELDKLRNKLLNDHATNQT